MIGEELVSKSIKILKSDNLGNRSIIVLKGYTLKEMDIIKSEFDDIAYTEGRDDYINKELQKLEIDKLLKSNNRINVIRSILTEDKIFILTYEEYMLLSKQKILIGKNIYILDNDENDYYISNYNEDINKYILESYNDIDNYKENPNEIIEEISCIVKDIQYIDNNYYLKYCEIDELENTLVRTINHKKNIEQTSSQDHIREDVSEELKEHLNKVFNFQNYRELEVYKNPLESKDKIMISQGQIVQNIIRNVEYSNGLVEIPDSYEKNNIGDVISILPTSAGKSLLYMHPSIYIGEKYPDYMTIVVEPLNALMYDQVKMYSKYYSKIAYINSELSNIEKEKILNGIRNKDISILYCSPEFLQTCNIDSLLGDRKLALLCFDESHTIISWGKEFRPDAYNVGKKISQLRKTNEKCMNTIIFACTATAVNGGQNDTIYRISGTLGLKNEKKYIGSPRRDDIEFYISQWGGNLKNLENDIKQILNEYDNVIIKINSPSFKKEFDKIKELLEELEQCKIISYSKNMSKEEKEDNLKIFNNEKNIILVTTEKSYDFIKKKINKNYKDHKIENYKEYKIKRNEKTSDKLEELISQKRKTICYVPYAKHCNEILDKIDEGYKEKVVTYHSKVQNKKEADEKFKSKENDVIAMIATKAYGMGIDIDDIEVGYLHAPTGDLSDLIQEAGRLARRPDLKGKFICEFNTRDINYLKSLNKMSALSNDELQKIIKKICDLYDLNKRQNMLVSPKEFGGIIKDIDKNLNKLKMSFLLIEEDLGTVKKGVPILILRGSTMFTNAYISISDEVKFNEFKYNYSKYINKIDEKFKVIEINLEMLWSDKYKKQSFPQFKREFFNNKIEDLNYEFEIKSKFILECLIDKNVLYNIIRRCLYNLIQVFEQMINKKYNESDIKALIKNTFLNDTNLNDTIKSKFLDNTVLESIMNIILNKFIINESSNKGFISETTAPNGENMYIVRDIGNCKKILEGSIKEFSKIVKKSTPNSNRMECFRPYNKEFELLIAAYIVEALGLGKYKITSGDGEVLFIRVNDYEKVKEVSERKFYRNKSLEEIKSSQNRTYKELEYFLTNKFKDSNERWNYIEDYFLGKSDL